MLRVLASSMALLCLAPAACGSQRPPPPSPAPTPAPLAAATPVPSAVPGEPPPPAVAAMLAEVDPSRLQATLAALVGFGTRHTLSDTVSEARGVGAARRWIKAEMERGARDSGRTGELAMQVGFDAHRMLPDGERVDRELELVNVVAILPGTLPVARERRYYVIGHYDSRNADIMDRSGDAPGANDDGSGTALVIELARVMARHRFDATLVFMATAGEEQGLLGARKHAEAARAAGLQISGVLSNDIVGDPTDPRGGSPQRASIRLFSEGLPTDLDAAGLQRVRALGALADGPSRQLARHVAEVAARERLAVRPTLVFRPDRFLRGGDHLAFTELGFPAVRLTEVAEKFDRQHEAGDVLAHVDVAYLADVARLNAAALAHLANAPSPPRDVQLVVDGLGNDTTLRWLASPEPDVAGYEVLRRATSAPDWEYVHTVGATTTITLPFSKDDFLFAVRAHDREGYRSPAAFPTLAR